MVVGDRRRVGTQHAHAMREQPMKRRIPLPRHFNWRALLLRFALNAVALALTAIIVPRISFAGDYRILTWLVISAAFGLLNAFVKPLVQFLMLPFLFVSYGFVVVVINSLMLFLLALLPLRLLPPGLPLLPVPPKVPSSEASLGPTYLIQNLLMRLIPVLYPGQSLRA